MPELDAATYNTIKTLCHQCDKLMKLGDYDRIVSKYYEAITLLPRPVRSNKLAPWLFSALGETYWIMKDYIEAGKAFGEAYCCPGCKENPRIILRLGQCFAQCGEEKLAREYLSNAVALGGDELLDGEDKEYYYILHPDERPAPEPEPEPANQDFDKILGAVLAYPSGSESAGSDKPDDAEDVELPVVVMQYDDADAEDKQTDVSPEEQPQGTNWFARGGKVVDISDNSVVPDENDGFEDDFDEPDNDSPLADGSATDNGPDKEQSEPPKKPGFFGRLLSFFKKKA